MDKKVLMISYYYPPCASIGGFRTIRFAKHLPEYSWNPIVLTIDPRFYTTHETLDNDLFQTHPNLQTINIYRSKVLPGAKELIDAIRKRKTSQSSNPVPQTESTHSAHLQSSSPSFWQQLKDAITLTLMIPDKKNGWLPFGVLKGLEAIKKEKPAMIYASGGPWTTFLIGVVLKKFTHVPLVIDFRDPWIENPYNEFHFQFEQRIHTFLERTCIRSADYVIANTEPLRQIFLSKYSALPAEKFVTITNGYDEDEFRDLPESPQSAHREKSLIISHVGTLYAKRSPEHFLSAVSSLIEKGTISKDALKIRFIGRVEIPGLRQRLEQEHLARIVEFVDFMPKREALLVSQESDVLLLIQPDTQLQVPAKLFEYIRLGKPIFAVCGPGATHDIITAHNFGIVAQYDDIENIQEQFTFLLTSLTKKQNNIYTDFDVSKQKSTTEFNSRTLTIKLVRLFERLLGEKGIS